MERSGDEGAFAVLFAHERFFSGSSEYTISSYFTQACPPTSPPEISKRRSRKHFANDSIMKTIHSQACPSSHSSNSGVGNYPNARLGSTPVPAHTSQGTRIQVVLLHRIQSVISARVG